MGIFKPVPLVTGITVSFTVIVTLMLNVTTPKVVPVIVYHKTLILAMMYVLTTYTVWFAHEVLTLQCRRQGHFASFYYPFIEESLKVLFIYALSRLSDDFNFIQVAIFVFVVNTIWAVCQWREFVDYRTKYHKFLLLHNIWASQGRKSDDKGRIFYGSITSEETLIGKRLSVYDLPAVITSQEETPPSEDSGTTKTSTTFAVPMERQRSILPNDLVDMLYSVSPKNTYHLNKAQAFAALDSELPSVDRDYDSIGGVDPLVSLPCLEENVDEPVEGIVAGTGTISEAAQSSTDDDTVAGTGTISEATQSSTDDGTVAGTEATQSSTDADDATTYNTLHNSLNLPSINRTSIHTSDTHFGGGGGGNYKLKLPGGGKLEFGGGAGFDYRRGGEDDDDGDDDGEKSSSIVSFVNWFSWLVPPLLPLGGAKTTGTFPLLKHRLSKYNLNRACSVLTYGTFASDQPLSQKPYKDFMYFVSYYFDQNKLQIDPFFAKYDRLLVDMSSMSVILHNMNELVWSTLNIIIMGLTAMENLSKWSILFLVLVKMFKLNHLKGGSYRLLILYEATINVVVTTLLVIYFVMVLS